MGRRPGKNLRRNGLPEIRKKVLFQRSMWAIMPSTRQFGYKKRRLARVKLGKRGPENRFLIALGKAAE
jgi:hypothetical protein